MPYKDKAKKLEQQRKYREANRWPRREYDRRRYEAKREETLERLNRYRKENPEKVAFMKRRHREANLERIAEADRRYYQANPEKVNANSRRRRARLVGSSGSHTETQWQALCDYYMNQCLGCGEVPDRLTRDHVVPLIMGGSDDIENIQPLCLSCNCRKNAKFIDYRV